MGIIQVELIILAPINLVFDELSDHASYSDFKAIDFSELINEGTENKNGNGAIRKIVTGPITFWEEISHYKSPTRFNYKIIKGEVNFGIFTFPLPFRHRIGRLTLEETSEGTKIIWLSEIESTLPIIGNYLTNRFVVQATKGFSSILRQVKKKLI